MTFDQPILPSELYIYYNQELTTLGSKVIEKTTAENIIEFERVANHFISHSKIFLSIPDTENIINKIVNYRTKYHLKSKLEKISPIYRTIAYQKYSQHAKLPMVLTMSELDQLLQKPNTYINYCLSKGILMRVPLDSNLNQVSNQPYFFICPYNWCSNCQKFEIKTDGYCSQCQLPLSNKLYQHKLPSNKFSTLSEYLYLPKFSSSRRKTIKYTLICSHIKSARPPLIPHVYNKFDPVKVIQMNRSNQEERLSWNQRKQILIQAGIICQLILDKISQYEYLSHSLYRHLQELEIIS